MFFIAGPRLISPVQFSLVSSRAANPLVFTLTFLIADSPATTVDCSRDETPLRQPQVAVLRRIVNTERSITEVTLEFRTGERGVYNCTISNDRVVVAPDVVFPAIITANISGINLFYVGEVLN